MFSKTTYYRTMTPRTRKPRQQPADVVVSSDVIWGAAAYADRLNGGEYRKEPEYLIREDGTVTDEVLRQPNKIYMRQAIEDQTMITAEDLHVGQQARDYIRKNLVIRGLKNDLSDFDRAMCKTLEMEQFMPGTDRYEIALVASQIRAYREGTRLEAVLENINRDPVAPVGEKIQLNATVIKSVYSSNYNVYFITAKTDENQMIFFSYREKCKMGEHITVRGSVKAHRPDATQLNRVRIV